MCSHKTDLPYEVPCEGAIVWIYPDTDFRGLSTCNCCDDCREKCRQSALEQLKEEYGIKV